MIDPETAVTAIARLGPESRVYMRSMRDCLPVDKAPAATSRLLETNEWQKLGSDGGDLNDRVWVIVCSVGASGSVNSPDVSMRIDGCGDSAADYRVVVE